MPRYESTETSIVLMLRLLHQRLSTRIERALVSAGHEDFTPVFGNMIPFVPPEGITISAVAQHVGITKQAVAQLAERLERLGYIERRPDPSDGRARRLFLTDRGRAVRPVARDVSRAAEAHWAELVGSAAVENLRDGLHDLLVALENEEIRHVERVNETSET